MHKQDFTNINKFMSTLTCPTDRQKLLILKHLTENDMAFFEALNAGKTQLKYAKNVSANNFGQGVNATPFVTVESLRVQHKCTKTQQQSFEF